MLKTRQYWLLLLLLAMLWSGCRGDEEVIPPVVTERVPHPDPANAFSGMYVLNEGNMGSNKASLDFLDLHAGVYHRNIFGTINPKVVFSLGDVGNDLQRYGNKLFAVVNASNLVEVMEASTGRHIGQVELKNCRYIAFAGGKAYVTSYAGPIALDPNAQQGEVAEIDTASLQITRKVTVGYQPDGIAVAGDYLFVANSGGYRSPNYDRTVSVIHRQSFTVSHTIEVAPNLHRILVAPNGKLYVSSRGDYKNVPASVYVVNAGSGQVERQLPFAASSWWMDGTHIYAIGSQYNLQTKQYTFTMTKYDTQTERILSHSFVDAAVFATLKQPYGIAVHPVTKHIYLTDAGNFVSAGRLHAFDASGRKLWEVQTGDIPAHFVFLPASLGKPNPNVPLLPAVPTQGNPYITRVVDYCPAPGQFVNKLPEATDADTPETMCAKVLAAIGNNKGGLVTLGGYGGYVTVAFDHRIPDKQGIPDFRIVGNAFDGNSEPAIVQVAYDANGNGKPDADEWHELQGSAYVQSRKGYRITYRRPSSLADDVLWTDNASQQGYIPRNEFHSQSYFPLWIEGNTLSFEGTLLPANATNKGTSGQPHWVLTAWEWGYADNKRSEDFDIANAVNNNGEKVNLPGADFIRIYTATNQVAGWLGETSSEVSNVIDLHSLPAAGTKRIR